jgi:Ca-activated chloride channel family protein
VVGYKKNGQGEMVLSRLDEITLQRIAAEAGGLYFRASAGGEEIDGIVEAIAALETGEQEGQFEMQGVERFEWFAGAAFLALIVETLISDRVSDGRRGS